MCQQGIVAIMPSRSDHIVVISKANSDDLARIELQFGKALNSNEVHKMLNDKVFEADISNLLKQQVQHTLRGIQRKFQPPFLFANWVQKDHEYSLTTKSIAMVDTQLCYSAKIHHPNAYDNEALKFLTKRCKVNEFVCDTAFCHAFLCLKKNGGKVPNISEGRYKCASLADAIKRWNPAH